MGWWSGWKDEKKVVATHGSLAPISTYSSCQDQPVGDEKHPHKERFMMSASNQGTRGEEGCWEVGFSHCWQEVLPWSSCCSKRSQRSLHLAAHVEAHLFTAFPIFPWKQQWRVHMFLHSKMELSLSCWTDEDVSEKRTQVMQGLQIRLPKSQSRRDNNLYYVPVTR